MEILSFPRCVRLDKTQSLMQIYPLISSQFNFSTIINYSLMHFYKAHTAASVILSLIKWSPQMEFIQQV